MNEPIAIIGMSCRFPKANNVEAFWQLLVNGVDAITEIPKSRFDLEQYYDSRPATPGKVASRWGGFLDRIEEFDAEFFGIAPREADWLDPQQRLLLELSWEALEDAGQDVDRLAGSATGVFVGMWLSDYEARLFTDTNKVDFYMTTGSGRYAASGRVSYALGLQGPSLTIDTACSSSLVAVHLACQSLRTGECTVALAGAANVILQPQITIAYSQSRMMTPDGHCKFGDARADGYVRSEGAAVLALKTLKQAQADGDPIYAVIRGSAVNNDGRSSGYLATPGQEGQEDLLRKAYQNAGVVPGHVHYVEAHGTGTKAGDPVEIGALGAVLSEGRAPGSKCVVGSVKTNIGHTEGAAGLAGVIKTALALQRRILPATLHFQEPNPQIPWAELPIEIRPDLSELPETDEPIIAGVSAFGIAGTNAHIVLEQAPADHQHTAGEHQTAYLLPLSAKNQAALADLARAYANLPSDIDLHDLAFSASTRKTHLEHRLALTVRNHEELRERLTAFAAGENQRRVFVTPEQQPDAPKITFVFSGQGGQWVGMGRGLAEQEPVFREALEACEAAMRPYIDWSLMAELNAPESDSRLEEIDVIQPVIFAVQVALTALWRSWGVEPDGVIGHSMGEVAAAYAAGVLSLEDAAHVICRRSQLMKRVSGQGAMALVELPYADVEQILAQSGYEDRLGIAVSNGPTSTVLSGDPAALQAVVSELEGQGVFCRFVKVDVAAHSPHMEALKPLLVEDLAGLAAQPEAVTIFSTVTGAQLAGEQFDAAYWGQNLRQPVRFAAAVEQALSEGFNTFIEFSPHPVLLSAIERGYGGQTALTTLPSTRRNEDERATMLESLGALYTMGYGVEWERLYPQGGNVLRPPTYPWQKERFWFAEDGSFDAGSAFRQFVPGSRFALLGQHLRSHSGTHYWETDIHLNTLRYLVDHKVQGNIVLPAAAYTEVMLEAAEELFGAGTHHLQNVAFKEALFLNADEATTLQVVAMPEGSGRATIQIYAKQGDTWTQHASGVVRPAEGGEAFSESPEAIGARLGGMRDGGEHYAVMEQRALNYGPTFQGIASLAAAGGESVAALRLHEDAAAQSSTYQIHPALLDACFQLLLATLPDDDRNTYLPIVADELVLYQRPDTDGALYAHARREDSSPDTLAGSVDLLDEAGHIVLTVNGLRMKRLEQADRVEDWLYEIQWIPASSVNEAQPETPGRWLIFTDAQGVGTALAARLEALGERVVTVQNCDAYESGSGVYGLNPINKDHFAQLLNDTRAAGLDEWRGVVYLWALDAAEDELPQSSYPGVNGALHLTQMLVNGGLSPRLWLVTRGAQAVMDGVTAPAQSSLWGLGAVLGNEHPELRPVRVDLDPQATDAEVLSRELWVMDGGDQVAFRNGERYTPRLAQRSEPEAEGGETRLVNPAEQPFRAEVTRPGVLDHLRLRAITRSAPRAGEVEIEVQATGLNFMNVMAALGMLPGYDNGVGPLGIECAGRIARVGEGVDTWQVGDEVVAVAFDSLATHAVTDARLVARKPARMSFEEAATIPIVFLTAYYALHHLARMEAGERVLIHAGAGGVGLAAIQLVQRAGAEAWVTAGTPEKRDFLWSLGVQAVMDSRSLAFADEVMAATNGEGVDIVLNSLAGEAITRGLAILRAYGRFVEIGKRDIYDNNSVGLLPFSKNLSYFAVDLDKMARQRPGQVGAMLRDIMAMVEAGELQPIPMTVFPAAQMADAFRYMAQGKHTGKIVIQPQAPDAPVFMTAATDVREDGSYLITGGLGGLGLTVTQWLAEKGARQIILTGRQKPNAAAQAVIEALQAKGIDARAVQADVTDPAAVQQLVGDIQGQLMPLRGVFHAAGLLDDSMMLQLDHTRFHNAMSPKVDGAWNLHQATQGLELDWFILFSSVAALLGTAGQANYAAGNAFMDGLAHYRQGQGLPALSINWGPWSDVGLAAAQSNRAERLASRGLGSLSPQDGIAALERVLSANVTQAAVMPFDAGQWVQTYPAAVNSSLLAGLLAEVTQDAEVSTGTQKDDIRAVLLAAEAGTARYKLLETHIREQVGYVLGLAASRIDAQKALRNMGLDSLMTLELRNRLESSLRLKLPATLVFNYPTVTALTHHLAEKMDIPLEATGAKEAAEPATGEPQTDELEGLTQSEVEAMLAEELSSLDDLLKGI